MTDNPLDDSDGKRNALIEKRAYHLWEVGGRPHGQHDEFWERASELVRMEEAAGFGQLPNPATVPGADPSRVQPVEEAFIQENLGEFPDSLSDQGERAATPSAALTHEEPAEPAPTAPRKPKGKADAVAPGKEAKPAAEGSARKAPAKKPAKG
ncbi:MAG: DUF2934 domain-containing protein [Janthinobacterium lividum]